MGSLAPVKAYSGDPRDTTRRGIFDDKFPVPVHITVEHHEIHAGNAFNYKYAGDGGFSVAFKVPATSTLVHMFFSYAAESDAVVTLYEGRTWTTNTGTVHPVLNRNRNSSITSILQEDKTATPAWTGNGVLLTPGGQVGGTAVSVWTSYGDKKQGVPSHDANEWVLKSNSTYVLGVVTVDGCAVRLDWYEHVDE